MAPSAVAAACPRQGYGDTLPALWAPGLPAPASACPSLCRAPQSHALWLLSSSSSLPCSPLQNPYHLQRKLQEMCREIRRCSAGWRRGCEEEPFPPPPHTSPTLGARAGRQRSCLEIASTGHRGLFPGCLTSISLTQVAFKSS